MEIYLVGGAVRDQLLGLPVTEHDYVVVGATPEELIQQGYRQVGKDFPVFLHPETNEEYALARTERKTGRGYKGFRVYAAPNVSLEQDLQRRDITINAMAQDQAGKIIDPFDGQKDLTAKKIRHVSEAFIEDPVRILRVARFSARLAPLGFTVAKPTMDLMRYMVDDGEVDHLVAERVWQEMVKALQAEKPSMFFRVLKECHALKVILPEIARLFHITSYSNVKKNMADDVFSLIDKDIGPKIRFALLFSDVNSKTEASEEDIAYLQQFCQRLRVPKQWTSLAKCVIRWHVIFPRVKQLTTKQLLTWLEHLDLLRRPKQFNQFLQACQVIASKKLSKEKINHLTEYIQQASEIMKTIDIADIQKQGLTGSDFADELRRLREQALEKFGSQ